MKLRLPDFLITLFPMALKGNIVREARVREGWTQAQLGERIGVGINLISSWELGKKPIPRKYEAPLRKALALEQRFGRPRADGLTPGSAEAKEADVEKKRRYQATRRRARRVARGEDVDEEEEELEEKLQDWPLVAQLAQLFPINSWEEVSIKTGDLLLTIRRDRTSRVT
jgi:transcriptional regulator with XRE-family HTH domain